MKWVLWNGSQFWVSAGVTCLEAEEATVIPEADALEWSRVARTYDDGGFWPVGIVEKVEGGNLKEEVEREV